MTREELISVLEDMKVKIDIPKQAVMQNNRNHAIDMAIKALEQEPCEDAISRQTVLDLLEDTNNGWIINEVSQLPSVNPQEPKTGHYEKHIDHTDCIWYGSDGGCPVTCSQYRDGWNDAMDYIFKNGKGYQPYRHDG